MIFSLVITHRSICSWPLCGNRGSCAGFASVRSVRLNPETLDPSAQGIPGLQGFESQTGPFRFFFIVFSLHMTQTQYSSYLLFVGFKP